MKFSLFLLFSLTSISAWSLDLRDIVLDNSLVFKSSKGPKHGAKLVEHALEEWWNVTDVGNTIDDGLIHSVFDGQCDPDVFDIYDMEVIYDEEALVEGKFTAIKRGSKSVAYAITPVVTYKAKYTVYKTHADSKKRKETEMIVDCPISADIEFYYENTKDKSVKYLGNSEDIHEQVDIDEPVQPAKHGIKVDGELISDQAAALALFEKLNNKENIKTSVCYFGEWVQAVESAHSDIEIFVTNKVKKAGTLSVEVKNTLTNKTVSGKIISCK